MSTLLQSRIKTLQLVLDQFSGDLQINHAKLNHPEEGELEWFELNEHGISGQFIKNRFSTPDFSEFTQDVLQLMSIQIQTARQY